MAVKVFSEYYLKKKEIKNEINMFMVEKEKINQVLIMEGGVFLTKEAMIKKEAKKLNYTYLCMENNNGQNIIKTVENKKGVKLVMVFNDYEEEEVVEILTYENLLPDIVIITKNSSAITLNIKTANY